MVVDLAKFALDPEDMEYLIDSDTEHRTLALVAKRHESLLICKLRRDRRMYLIFRYPLGPSAVPARLMDVDPTHLSAPMEGEGKLSLLVLIAKRLYVVATDQVVQAKDGRGLVVIAGS